MSGKDVDLSKIGKDADKTADKFETPTEAGIAERLDQIDLLVADLSQLGSFNSKAAEFVAEATTEIRWNRYARVAVLVVAGLIVAGLSRLVWLIASDPNFETLRGNAAALSAVMAASVGGGILLSVGVTRAVFSSFKDRNEGTPTPDHLKAVIDEVRSLFN